MSSNSTIGSPIGSDSSSNSRKSSIAASSQSHSVTITNPVSRSGSSTTNQATIGPQTVVHNVSSPSKQPEDSGNQNAIKKTLRKTASHLFLRPKPDNDNNNYLSGKQNSPKNNEASDIVPVSPVMDSSNLKSPPFLEPGFPKNYKGFHAPKSNAVPPFKSPVKPSFDKKNQRKKPSIFNKFIGTRKGDSDDVEAVNSYGNVVPEAGAATNLSPDAAAAAAEKSRQNSNSSAASSRSHHAGRKGIFNLYQSTRLKSVSSDKTGSSTSTASYSPVTSSSKPTSFFDLDLVLDNLDMSGVVKKDASRTNTSGNASPNDAPASNSPNINAPKNPSFSNQRSESGWEPPDSWAVKHDLDKIRKDTNVALLDPPFFPNSSMSTVNRDYDESTDPLSTESGNSDMRNFPQAAKNHKNGKITFRNYVMKPKSSDQTPNWSPPRSELQDHEIGASGGSADQTIIYESQDRPLPELMHTLKSLSGNFMLRIWKKDGEFKTFSPSIDITAAELLLSCKKKFFLQSAANYQLVFKIGKSSKVLEPDDRPLQMLCFILLLAGYDATQDSFKILGSKDSIVYLCKFELEDNDFQPFIDDEENLKTNRDYVSVDLVDMGLYAIPLAFYQHTYEIEELDVSENPSILLPADFIGSCNNLRKISFTKNRANKFPQSLLEARKLTRLDVENNLISQVPERIGSLVYLTKLFLNCNNISKLPKSIGSLRNLKVLNLSSNNFEVFPIAVTELEQLAVLDLSFNQISMISQSVVKLKNLEELNMATNCLSGALPWYISELSKVRTFCVQYNELTNLDAAGKMKSLEILCASKNNISRMEFQAERLRILQIDRNPIVEVPRNSIMLESLTTLNLMKAKLTSFENADLLKLSNLETLLLDKNDLTFLPSEIGSLKRLVYLSAYSNRLQSIPDSIGNLKNLQFLDLHSNNIKTVPDSIWNCSLFKLNLSSNLLQGFPVDPKAAKLSSGSTRIQPRKSTVSSSSLTTSSSVSEDVMSRERLNSTAGISYSSSHASDLASSLQVLSVADNTLSDDCFESISSFGELKSLNLSYNELIEIPSGVFRRLPRLHELYISGNELTNLPGEDLAMLKYLKILHINGNKIQILPQDISKIRSLSVFDAGSNQLKYNISNYQYDWNWQWNLELRYLNFSGNKRLEISRQYTHAGNKAIDNIQFDSFVGLKNLRVLGLIDVTLKSSESSLPDECVNTRVRTTPSEIYSYKYGIADTLGQRDAISTREIMYSNFRGHEDELLICLFDGKNDQNQTQGNKVSQLLMEHFRVIFTEELDKKTNSVSYQDCMRRSFLSLNSVINSKHEEHSSDDEDHSEDPIGMLSYEDIASGCSITVVYVKGRSLYSANVGDSMGLISKSNGDHELITVKHDPTTRSEFERIRLCGGFVSGKGEIDGVTDVSRAAGFLNLLPHINANPSIKELIIGGTHEMLVIATSELWDHVSYETVVDVISQNKKEPMTAAAKLRDFAIAYGAKDKMTVIILSLNTRKKSSVRQIGSRLSITEDTLLPIKKRKDRLHDSNLSRLDHEITPPSGSIAMVFTDIKNSTLLWEGYPSAMRSAIKTHNGIMRRQLRFTGGYEVKTEGDAFMVSFPSPISALVWCLNVQLQLLTGDWPVEILESSQCYEITDSKNEVIYRGLSVRMGIHWGEPVCEPDAITGRMDYFGPMVNRASRVSSVADGGQISISSDFLKELSKYVELHEKVKNGGTIKEVYGDAQIGVMLENEMEQLDNIGYVIEELGEKKLKGLENSEFISLIFPDKLKERINFLTSDKPDKTDHTNSGILGGLVSLHSIYEMMFLAIKLEHVCSVLTAGTSVNYDILSKNGDKAQKIKEWSEKLKRPNVKYEEEYLMLMDNAITRIENAVTILKLRQALWVASEGKIAQVHEIMSRMGLEDFFQKQLTN